MLIRTEIDTDRDAVYEINVEAFGTPSEANLVDVLRDQTHPVVSFVAEDEGELMGHIMFSPVSLSGHPELKIMGLAPMAVAPDHQCKGIGSALVRAGLERCRELGFAAVVVIGHPEYYPRFGFSPAFQFDIASEFEVPEEAFLAIELQAGALSRKSGTVKYHAAFHNV